MAERPDLDRMSEELARWNACKSNYSTVYLHMGKLLTYCRELEAENKRLRETVDADDRRHAKWLAAAGDCGP